MNSHELIIIGAGTADVAAGDFDNVPAKQIIAACGKGANTCISVFDYVHRMKRQL